MVFCVRTFLSLFLTAWWQHHQPEAFGQIKHSRAKPHRPRLEHQLTTVTGIVVKSHNFHNSLPSYFTLCVIQLVWFQPYSPYVYLFFQWRFEFVAVFFSFFFTFIIFFSALLGLFPFRTAFQHRFILLIRMNWFLCDFSTLSTMFCIEKSFPQLKYIHPWNLNERTTTHIHRNPI